MSTVTIADKEFDSDVVVKAVHDLVEVFENWPIIHKMQFVWTAVVTSGGKVVRKQH